ncbi:MAG: exodeoxyribonuclease III [Candidatus Adiutrix sp.]|jgi:exodeoxyribonuclease-3|nr:exodeoxyribonuclease III [Candidatus Adiutrix sp.]
MKFVSWNVNGLRATLGKGFMKTFQALDADVFCLQETKMEQGQAAVELDGYQQYWSSAEKKGYSGTAVFCRPQPLSAAYGLGIDEHDHEGRTITLEFERYFLVNVYTPNSRAELARLDYRMVWDDAFRGYLVKLDARKPVVICGDLNVAHEEIDLKNPKTNRRNAGFTDEERAKLTELLNAGFTDTYRSLHPGQTGAYTWWSWRANARANNAGWRIDYFLISNRLTEKIKEASIHPDFMGSDHCPVSLELEG